MKIKAITAKKVSVPLKEPFTMSIGVINSYEAVLVRVETDEGITGYGEGMAPPYITGETVDIVLYAVNLLKPALIGMDPHAISDVHRKMDSIIIHNSSAKAAIDIALYDIMSKAACLPLYVFLGGGSEVVETDRTIGLDKPDTMAAHAAALANEGYRFIKVKAGADDSVDAEAIRLIRAAAPDVDIKVDANQGWSAHQALKMLNIYAQYNVTAVEQPVPYWDVDGLAHVRSRSPLPIIADESCFTPQDAARLIKYNAADIINIKLMKCGGLYRAMQICDIAEASGVRCMLGCMLESSLSIAAGAALAASHQNIIYSNLNSFQEFDDSTIIQEGFMFHAPVIMLDEHQQGIGVKVIF